MISIQQHLAKNSQYANETHEWAVVQVRDGEGVFRDYSRTDIRNAKIFVERQPSSKWRVVDWISKEEINLDSRMPEVAGGAVESNLATRKLGELVDRANQALYYLREEQEGNFTHEINQIHGLAVQLKTLVDGW